MQLPKITTRQLFKFGAICFGIVAVSSLIGMAITWENYLPTQKISGIANAIFNFIITYFFFYMYKTSAQEQTQEVREISEKELEDMFKKEVKKSGKDNTKKRS